MEENSQVIIIGGGAAGIFCALQLGLLGIPSLVLEKNSKLGKKIIVSGGGNCNFTNKIVGHQNYESSNVKFSISALKNYSSDDFIKYLESYNFNYYEKKLGQLFCKNKSKSLLELLLTRCRDVGVKFELDCEVKDVKNENESFEIITDTKRLKSRYIVLATGGLSFPGIGVSDLGYKIGKKIGHKIRPTEPALVPFILSGDEAIWSRDLSGLSLPVKVSCNSYHFEDDLLFTHKGLSGPAILKISLYWMPADEVEIDLLPNENIKEMINSWRKSKGKNKFSNLLVTILPKKLAFAIVNELRVEDERIADLTADQIREIESLIHHWKFIPLRTEGFKKAEVTRGGVCLDKISSKTMESQLVENIYFIGEVLDVTGWLGGYNFQWAWSSAYSASQAIFNKINYIYE
ncbi:MAG: aminoacetone oxidase family FAD-binding enzyme [Oligoflexia bacterium]|nr:aminoacetone oxidase family FAD-binding enzyme [Oligoflexia bacterium]